MMRLILCALLLVPSAAMADPVTVFVAGALAATNVITIGTFLFVVASSAVGEYQKSRARKKARDAYNAGLTDRTVMIRTATEPRDLVLGRVRKSGVMYPIGQAGSKSEKMVFIILLAGHECDAIEEVWFNDKAVALDASGNVTSSEWFKGETRSESTSAPESSTSFLLPYDPIAGSVHVASSTAFRVSGVTVSGRVVSWVRTATHASYSGNATTVFRINYQRDIGTPKARVWWRLGTDSQAADARLIELFPGKWTAAHRLAGITYAVVELDYDQDIFSAGIPNISFVMRGAKVHDPRTGSTAWSENPALLLRHAALHSLCGNLPAVAGEHDSIIAAANACDVSVSTTVTKDGTDTTTSGPRYVAGYVFKGGNRPKDALDELAEAMGGKWAVVGNQLVVKAGEYSAPLLSLGDNDFSDAGAVQVSPGRPREQLVNVVTGKFSDKSNGYHVLDFPRVASGPDITKDGAELPLDVEFAAVSDVAQAQHLGAIMIRDGRQALTVAASFKLGAYRAELFDTISLSSSVYGWQSKAFEVLSRSWSLGGLLRLTLKETAPGIYARATAFEGVDIAPNTDMPDPRIVPFVTGLAATSGATQTPDGTMIPRVRVSWDAFTAAAFDDGVVEIRYWPASGSPDDAQTAEAPAAALSALIDGLTGGAPIIITARVRNGVPVRGDWCPQIGHTVASVTITAAENIIRNPSFDDSGQEWAAWDTLPASDLSVPPGAPSARVLRSNVRDYYARDTATGIALKYPVRPSTTYEFQVWVGLNAPIPVDVGLRCLSFDAGGVDLNSYPGAAHPGDFTGWRRVSARVETGPAQHYLTPLAWIGQLGTDHTAYFSAPIIRELSGAVIDAATTAIWDGVSGVNVTTPQVAANAITAASTVSTFTISGGFSSPGGSGTSDFFNGPVVVCESATDEVEIEVSGYHLQGLFFNAPYAAVEVWLSYGASFSGPFTEVGARRPFISSLLPAGKMTSIPVHATARVVPGVGTWCFIGTLFLRCLDASGNFVGYLKDTESQAIFRHRVIKK